MDWLLLDKPLLQVHLQEGITTWSLHLLHVCCRYFNLLPFIVFGYLFMLLTPLSRVILIVQLGLILGLVLSFFLFSLLPFASRLFTNDINVLQLISVGIPYVAATQPVNALAFIFYGVNYGISDFTYSAYSMFTTWGF